MKDLREVTSFGGIDADTDTLLEECFQDHQAYQETKSHQRFLVLGRKGSGKTAIFKKFSSMQDFQIFSYGHTFTDYPWHHHDKQAAIGVPEEERYVHSWRYLILITMAKILLNKDQSRSRAAVEEMGRIEKFVVDSYGTRDPDVAQIFSPPKILRFPSFSAAGISLSIKEISLTELPAVVQEVNRNLSASIVSALNSDFNYYVCFDQLDLGFNPADDNYKKRLIGLILAARDINVKAREAGKRFSALVFLRDDIYQALQFEDKNKVTEGFVTRIEWDTGRTHRTLKDLMQRRFATVLEIDPEKAWETVFDETEKMSGRQTKYQHMLDRTFLRPRDMIKFCNETLSAYRSGQQKSEKISNRDLIAARKNYSDYFISELEDEIFKHMPNHEKYIEVLKSLDNLQFSRGDFDVACSKRAKILPSNYDTSLILKELFEFSLIAYYSSGGAGYGGSEYVWKYKDHRARFNEAAGSFKIHPGLMEALGLKKFARSGSIFS